MLVLQILELLEHTPIFSAGYKCILHIHSVVEECECTEMRYELDPKTKSKKKVHALIIAAPCWRHQSASSRPSAANCGIANHFRRCR
jgi:hypothetical protein